MGFDAMKRTAILFTAVFLILCLVPGLGMLVLGPSGARANEAAPRAPELFDRGGALNAGVLGDTADYLNESFALRQELITLWARVEALFGESAEDGVVLGGGGWLYYADELADFTGTEPMTERGIFAAASNLALMSEYAGSLGADFVFTVAPNKSSLYPGPIEDYPRSGGASDAARLAAELERQGVKYADLFELFNGLDGTYYFEHDSHWTSRGAAAAADAVNAALGVESAYGEGYEYETVPHSGDLFEMLYPSAADPETDDAPRGLGFTQGEGLRPDSITIDTAGSGEGTLLCFRDSFGELLYPFLAESWGAARFSRQAAYDLTAAAELSADAVVIELVERNLSWLYEQPAVFPAPARDIDAGPAEPADGVSMEAGSAAEGYHSVTGVISAEIGVDSPVYIRYNGQSYEALLSPGGFTAMLPGEGGGEYTVLWYNGDGLNAARINITGEG